MVLLNLILFFDLLFTPEERVLSFYGTDISHQFISWREFAFDEIRKGNFPLWCPNVYSGMPFFGGFQSALLYPLNYIYLILPVHKAINFSIAIHVFLAGLFMYLWCEHRKLHILASLVSSFLFMFCGAHFLHIMSGHLTILCTLPWVPLLFLSVDGFYQDYSFKWIFLGIFSVSMQILAGHPQYVYFTFLAVVFYIFFLILSNKEKKLKFLPGVIFMYAGGALLSAVQLITGLDSSLNECVRAGGVDYKFASVFSYPPECFITFLSPDFFGDMVNFKYWGRCYLWETSIFIGITGLVLAIYGAIYGLNKNKKVFSLMVVIFLIFALGSYTPLFKIFYYCIPLFNKFRGTSKFIFQASLFLIMLSGTGFDTIIRSGKINKKFILCMFVAFLIIFFYSMFLGGIFAPGYSQTVFKDFLNHLNNSQDSLFLKTFLSSPDFVFQAKAWAFKSLIISLTILFFLILFFYFFNSCRKLVYMIFLMAFIEIFFFAKSSITTFDIGETYFNDMVEFQKKTPGDYRILNLEDSNIALFTGMKDIWGRESTGPIKRYAQFMAFTQGEDPDTINVYLHFSSPHRLYTMLRLRYIFEGYGKNKKITVLDRPMERLVLIRDYLVIKDREEIFNKMGDDKFDPGETVILEASPSPEPVNSGEKDSVKIVNSSTDHITVEANLEEPAILLITDTYSKDWHVTPLNGSIQSKYNIMPANYCLQAIPLSGGHHLFRVEYLPFSFSIGKWISIFSCLAYIITLLWYIFKKSFNK